MTYRYARDRAMTLLIQGAYIERRSKASPKSRAEFQDVYYLVWEQPQDNAGLMLTCERRMWRQTFFKLLEENRIVPMIEYTPKQTEYPTRLWVLKEAL